MALAGFTSITFVNAKLESTWRRRLFIVSAFSYCTTFSFVPLVGLWGLWVLAASSGFFIQLIMINQANASGIIGKAISERERGIALYTVALSASLVVGPLVNSAILTRVSLAYSFAAFSVFPISAAILALFFPFPKEEHSKSQNDLQTPILKNADPPTPVEARSFRATLKNSGFQTALFNNAMYSIPFAAIVSFGGLFSQEYYHASNISVQFYFAIFYSVSFVFRILLLLSPRVNIRHLSAASSLLTLAGVTLLVTVINPFSYAISLALLGVPHGLTYTSSLIIISRSSGEFNRNTFNSYYATFSTMINVTTPFLMGLIADLIGLRFSFSLLLVSISFFAYMIFRKLSKWKSLYG